VVSRHLSFKHHPNESPEDVTSDFMNVKWYGASLHLEIFGYFNNYGCFVLVFILCEKISEAKRWGETNESFFNS
jgi:hypothetical protein